ncbi:MAG: hypothetical protein ACP5LZ_07700 [Fervidicoccaceae archaeon]
MERSHIGIFSLALAIAVISALALTLISLYIMLFHQDVWGRMTASILLFFYMLSVAFIELERIRSPRGKKSIRHYALFSAALIAATLELLYMYSMTSEQLSSAEEGELYISVALGLASCFIIVFFWKTIHPFIEKDGERSTQSPSGGAQRSLFPSKIASAHRAQKFSRGF